MRKTPNYVDYCYSCGAPTKPEATGTFSSKTGTELYRSVCSKTPCQCDGHTGHGKASTWWKRLNFYNKCDRCGKDYRVSE